MLDNIKFNEQGLVPAIIQDIHTKTVLMLAYMNAESLQKTVETGVTWFYSRSRKCLWNKGETSGNIQKVCDIFYDCDADTLLVTVEQTGVACHEGTYSCFSRKLTEKPLNTIEEKDRSILGELYQVIMDRKQNPPEGSYTAYLFDKGQDKILKKVGEEAAETIIASKNNNKTEILYEMADLWYHCLVLLAFHNITPEELLIELRSRRK